MSAKEWLEDIRVKQVKALAHRAHKGITRKYGDDPYIVHPQRVAEAVANWCDGKVSQEKFLTMVCAAWAHDVIEDCPQISESEIEEAAGGLPVLAMVKELTNPSKRLKSLPRAQRKAIDREHLQKVSIEAKIIKLLDRLDNLKDIETCGDVDFILLYAWESELLADTIGDADAGLVDALRKQIVKLREMCDTA